jgi:hypothetical protein
MRRLRPSVSDLPAATGTGRGLAQAEEGQCVYRPYSPSMRDKSSATYTQVHTMPHSPHAVSVHSPSVRHWAASQRPLLCRSGAGRPPCAAACACPYRCLCRSRCSHVGMLCVCVVDDGRRGVGAQQEEEEEHRNRGGTESETRQAQKSIIYKLSNHLNAAALPFIFWLLFSVRRGVLVARRRSPLTSLSLGSWGGGAGSTAQEGRRTTVGNTRCTARQECGSDVCHRERACSIQQQQTHRISSARRDEQTSMHPTRGAHG